MNLVLDHVKETMRGKDLGTSYLKLIRMLDDEGNETTRDLGLVVARGTLLVLLSPMDGSEEIENPFAQPTEE